MPDKPKPVNRLVDLGVGVIRVQHDYTPAGVFPNTYWERITTLTLMTPSETALRAGSVASGPRSAESASARMTKAMVDNLMDVLDDEPPDDGKIP